MSKKEEILHKLNTEDRNYIKEKFKEKDQQIADLEAKAEESENNYKDARELGVEQFYSFTEMLKSSQEEIDQLKQQLAEKEKEIRSYEHELENYEHELEVYKHNDNIYANSIRSFANKNKQERNQTAIAELEKLLEKTQTLDVMVQSGHYINQKKVNVVFKDVIDQQIKSLKGDSNE